MDNNYLFRVLKNRFYFLLTFSLLLIFASCNFDFLKSSNPEENNNSASSLLGIWDWFESREGEGTVIGQNETWAISADTADYSITMEFVSGGIIYLFAEAIIFGQTITVSDTATWRADNSKIYFDEKGTDPYVLNYSISKNILELSEIYSESGQSMWRLDKYQKRVEL